MAALVCTIGFVGCAPGGPTRYEVSGEVTLNGQPAPLGRISFQPDASVGNDGPGATAIVKEGRFKTASGKGVSAGPHLVNIIAYDGVPNSESMSGKPLTTKAYVTTITIPLENSVQNFDVPSSHLVEK